MMTLDQKRAFCEMAGIRKWGERFALGGILLEPPENLDIANNPAHADLAAERLRIALTPYDGGWEASPPPYRVHGDMREAPGFYAKRRGAATESCAAAMADRWIEERKGRRDAKATDAGGARG